MFCCFLYQKVLRQGFMKKKVVLKPQKKNLFVFFLFLQLRTRLVNSVESNLKFCTLKVIFKSPCKLNSQFRYKDSRAHGYF